MSRSVFPRMSALRSLLYIIPILCALWVADQWLTDDQTVGWERNSVRNSLHRWENNTRARVAIMGSSTSKDWLPANYLQRILKLKRGQVIDAHINGCHQGCTWSEVRRMLQRHRMKRCRWRGKDRCDPPKKKRFSKVFFGTNLFQMCEDGHSKRVLQHRMLLPSQDIAALIGIYMSARDPMRQMGRFLGMQLSGAYGDTRALRDYWGQKWLGKTNSREAHRWYRKDRPKKAAEILSCDYQPENVALKLKFTEALLDDLRELSDETFVMLLPDRSRSLKDPEQERRWKKHIEAHRALISDRPWVKLVDLTQGGVNRPKHFRDGFHLKRSMYKVQQRLLKRRLKENGALPIVLPKPVKGARVRGKTADPEAGKQ